MAGSTLPDIDLAVHLAPAPPVRSFPHAPEPPVYDQPRAHDVAALRAALHTAPRVLCLHGPAGAGKSTLAAALARDPAVLAEFPGGVYWLPLGPAADVTVRQAALLAALAPALAPPYVAGAAEGRRRLAALPRGAACLLVLDDVRAAAEALACLSAPATRILITTRDAALAATLEAAAWPIPSLLPAAARALLAAWAGDAPGAVPDPAAAAGVPLALVLAGAAGRARPARWPALRDALAQPAPLAGVVLAAIETLTREEQTRYSDLAVLAPGAAFPLAVLDRLWGAHGLDEDAVREVAQALTARALLQHDGNNVFYIHPALHDELLRDAGPRLRKQHQRLLDIYGAHCPRGEWAEGPDDGYFLEHLPYHLLGAGKDDALQRLLTAGPAWAAVQEAAGYGLTGFAAAAAETLRAYPDPLRADKYAPVAQLHAARAALAYRRSPYADQDLHTLVALGRAGQALSQARARPDPAARLAGLRAVAEALAARPGDAPERAGPADHRTRAAALDALAAHAVTQDDWELVDIAQIFLQAERFAPAAALAARAQNPAARAAILRHLAIAARSDEAFTQALYAAHRVPDEGGRPDALGPLAAALAQAGDPRADTLFGELTMAAHRLPPAPVRDAALGRIAGWLIDAGRLEPVAYLAGSVQDREARAGVLARLATALARNGAYDDAEKLARSVPDPWQQANALCELARALAQAGHFPRAGAIANGIAGPWQRGRALHALAGALAAAGQAHAPAVFAVAHTAARAVEAPLGRAYLLLDLAEDGGSRAASLLEEAATVAQTIPEPEDRAQALRDVAVALARRGEAEQAQTLARAMPAPDRRLETLRLIATALADAKHPDAARALEEVLTLAPVPTAPETPAYGQALQALTHAFNSARRPDLAAAAARALPESPRRVAVLRDLAAELALQHDLRAGALFDEAAAAAQQLPTTDERNLALAALAAALATGGRVERAVALARELPGALARDQALEAIAGALARAGNVPQATELARGLRDTARRDAALTVTAAALAAGGRGAQAAALARAIGNPAAQAAVLLHANRFDEALAAARNAPDGAARVHALCVVAVAMARARDARAPAVLEGAVTLARGQEDLQLAVIKAMLDAGLWERAAARAAQVGDTVTRAELLGAAAAGLARAGQLKEAHAVARTAPVPEFYHSGAATALVRALAESGLPDTALTTARAIPDPATRAAGLAAIAAALTDGERAQALIDEALDAIWQTVPDSAAKAPDPAAQLPALAGVLAQHGRFAAACETLGPQALDALVRALAEWAPFVERAADGQAVRMLREVVRIAGWYSPAWRVVDTALAACPAQDHFGDIKWD